MAVFRTNAVVGSDDTPREMDLWVAAYCVALTLSGASSLAKSLHLLCHARKRLNMTRSAIHFVVWHYQITTSLHAWIALSFYLFAMAYTKQLYDAFDEEADASTKDSAVYAMNENTSDPNQQADVLSRFIHAYQGANATGMQVAVNLENVMMVLCAYWILLITFELFIVGSSSSWEESFADVHSVHSAYSFELLRSPVHRV